MGERHSKPTATVGCRNKSKASEPQLEDAESHEEVFECVVNLAGRLRGAIKSITHLCNKGTANSILCSINVRADALSIANAIGGGALGSFLYREIHPVRNNFLCMKRQDGKLKSNSCSCGGGVTEL